jgi:hypothetical protein
LPNTSYKRSVPIDSDLIRRVFHQYPDIFQSFQDFGTEHFPHLRRGLRENAGLCRELLDRIDPAPLDLETSILTADDENKVQQVSTQFS